MYILIFGRFSQENKPVIAMIIWRGSIYFTISKTQLFQILTIVFNVATVNSLIMEKLPKDARISTSSKDMIIQLCMTFLTSLSAKANNVCGAKNKKTVCPDHVIDAMVVSEN